MLRILGTTAEGLSWEEARSRLVQYGPNRLPVTKGPSALALLLEQVTSPLIYALVASAAVAFAFGEVDDGVVVLAVVILNSLIGFGQEYRAGRAIAALSDLVAEPARVRRDGEWVELPAEELVPSDVVAVAEGERITADVRLLETQLARKRGQSPTTRRAEQYSGTPARPGRGSRGVSGGGSTSPPCRWQISTKTH